MSDLIERLRSESERREAAFTRVPTMSPPMKYVHGDRLRAMLTEAAAALEAAREDAERAMDGLRYAALVWSLSDEIEQSPEAVDSATRRMIRGGAEFRRSRPRAFQAIDQARGKGEG